MIELNSQSTYNALKVETESKCGESDFFLQKRFLRKRVLLQVSSTSSIEQGQVSKKKKLRKTVKIMDKKPKVSYRDYTEEDLRNAWYSGSDYGEFMNECRVALKKVDSVDGDMEKLDPYEEVCMRGLEDQTIPEVFHLKRRRKKTLIHLVVNQQEMHKMTGNVDAGRLRAISMMFSKQAKEWAVDLGALDEAYAAEESR
jgi:hypothetical protein